MRSDNTRHYIDKILKAPAKQANLQYTQMMIYCEHKAYNNIGLQGFQKSWYHLLCNTLGNTRQWQ